MLRLRVLLSGELGVCAADGDIITVTVSQVFVSAGRKEAYSLVS